MPAGGGYRPVHGSSARATESARQCGAVPLTTVAPAIPPAGCTSLAFHPTQEGTFLVGTAEGPINKCFAERKSGPTQVCTAVVRAWGVACRGCGACTRGGILDRSLEPSTSTQQCLRGQPCRGSRRDPGVLLSTAPASAAGVPGALHACASRGMEPLPSACLPIGLLRLVGPAVGQPRRSGAAGGNWGPCRVAPRAGGSHPNALTDVQGSPLPWRWCMQTVLAGPATRPSPACKPSPSPHPPIHPRAPHAPACARIQPAVSRERRGVAAGRCGGVCGVHGERAGARV